MTNYTLQQKTKSN